MKAVTECGYVLPHIALVGSVREHSPFSSEDNSGGYEFCIVFDGGQSSWWEKTKEAAEAVREKLISDINAYWDQSIPPKWVGGPK